MSMALRQSLCRPGHRALRHQCLLTNSARRGLAAPASGSFQYETTEEQGVKCASRDLAGPITTVAMVSKAGTRYQPLPGLAEGLEKFAFRNTERRSALRLQREAELLGGSLFSFHTRESVVVGAKCFRDDLAYFVEVLAEVASQTKYLDYEFTEQVMDGVHRAQVDILAHPERLAQASAHSLAFHRGLGEPLHPTSSTPLTKYLSADVIGAYSTLAYRKPSIAVVANGAEHQDLSKWTSEFFGSLRTEAAPDMPKLEGEEQSKYYGGEERIAHASGNAIVLAFPGSSSLTGGFYKPEIAVLAQLLGGQSAIKWSPGFSLLGRVATKHQGLSIATKSAIYSDAGLLFTQISGKDARAVGEAAIETVETLKKVANGDISSEDISRARAQARFAELEHGQLNMAGLELTGAGLVNSGKPYQLDESAKRIGEVKDETVKKAAKDMLAYKASVSAVGDLFMLPFAEEMGLKV